MQSLKRKWKRSTFIPLVSPYLTTWRGAEDRTQNLKSGSHSVRIEFIIEFIIAVEITQASHYDI